MDKYCCSRWQRRFRTAVKTPLRASDCYYVNQSDIHYILRWLSDQVNASATSIQPVHHLPPTPPPPAAHWSLLTAKLVTCIKWSWIESDTHDIDIHGQSHRSFPAGNGNYGGCADWSRFVQPEWLGSPRVLGSAPLVDSYAFSLLFCAYGWTQMCPLDWWMSSTPKYNFADHEFVNILMRSSFVS